MYLTSLGALETAKPTNDVDCKLNKRSLQSCFQMGETTQYKATFEGANQLDINLVKEKTINMRVKSCDE